MTEIEFFGELSLQTKAVKLVKSHHIHHIFQHILQILLLISFEIIKPRLTVYHHVIANYGGGMEGSFPRSISRVT